MQLSSPSRPGTVYGSANAQSGHHNIQNSNNGGMTNSGVVNNSGRISTKFKNINKRVHVRVGKFDLGLGHLAALAAVLVGGGGTAAVATHATTGPSTVVRGAVGTWHLTAPHDVQAGTVTSMVLVITPQGVYQASLGGTTPDGTMAASCTGDVTSRERLLLFTPFDRPTGTSTTCLTFTATAVGRKMTVGLGNNSVQLERA